MSYEVIFHRGALREFDKLPAAAQQRIGEVVDALAEDPRPQGAAKVAGADAYRIRVGDYRAVYAVKDDRLVVLVVKVGHRKDVYTDIRTIGKRLKE